MTISTQPTVRTYDCDGSTFTFPFQCRTLNPADLLVLRIDASGAATTLSAGLYTVTGIGSDDGVTVITNETYADGQIRIWLAMDVTQLNTYVDNGPFPAQSHEDALDRLTLLNAMRKEEFGRTIRAPLGRAGLELPPVDQMASQLWASDADGSLTFVPTIKGDDITSIDASSVYFDHNSGAYPRLMLDVSGNGDASIDGVNGGGMIYATLVKQDDIALVDSGVQRNWFGGVFRGQQDGTPAISNKRSRFLVGINVRSEISAVQDVDFNYLPQEVGGLVVSVAAGTGTSRAKVEGIVVSAKEEDGLVTGSKGVAVQAITTRTTQGPDVDDRNQISDAEDGDEGTVVDDPTDAPTGSRLGSFTLRLNGGTVKVDGEPVFGGWRSWCASLSTGRAGYLNGHVLGKRHTNGSYTDAESVGGWGGVWGGRGFWHANTFATYAKDACPGWVTIGHDGIPDSGTSGAAAPIDIVVDTGVDGPANWTGAVAMFNGVKVLGVRATGWTASTGTASRGAWSAETVGALTFSATPTQAECEALRDACTAAFRRLSSLEADLTAHGLIGA